MPRRGPRGGVSNTSDLCFPGAGLDSHSQTFPHERCVATGHTGSRRGLQGANQTRVRLRKRYSRTVHFNGRVRDRGHTRERDRVWSSGTIVTSAVRGVRVNKRSVSRLVNAHVGARSCSSRVEMIAGRLCNNFKQP